MLPPPFRYAFSCLRCQRHEDARQQRALCYAYMRDASAAMPRAALLRAARIRARMRCCWQEVLSALLTLRLCYGEEAAPAAASVALCRLLRYS